MSRACLYSSLQDMIWPGASLYARRAALAAATPAATDIATGAAVLAAVASELRTGACCQRARASRMRSLTTSAESFAGRLGRAGAGHGAGSAAPPTTGDGAGRRCQSSSRAGPEPVVAGGRLGAEAGLSVLSGLVGAAGAGLGAGPTGGVCWPAPTLGEPSATGAAPGATVLAAPSPGARASRAASLLEEGEGP
jgi:hypothetical protein